MKIQKYYIRRKGTAGIRATYGGTLEGARKWFAEYYAAFGTYYLSDEEGRTL